MPAKTDFKVGIKNNVTGDLNDGVCELYYLDRIENKEVFDWDSMQVEERSLLADIINQVKYYNPKKIVQCIDSGGGSADVGFGVYNYTKNIGCKVETKILNLCGSIATVIACAGGVGKIIMPRNGLYVIHQASNVALGTAKDLREAADLADKYTEMMLDVYVQNNRKGKTRDEIYALIENGDHWMTGSEAKEMGFVDDTYNDEAVTVTASINIAKGIYANIPQRILDMQEKEVEPTTNNFLKEQFMELKNFVTAAIDKIKGNKVDPKSTNISADIAEAIAQPLSEMAEAMQAEIATEREGIETRVTAELTTKLTASVTEAVTAQFKPTIDAQAETIKNLTADLEKMAGKETTTTTTTAEVKKGLVGKWANED